MIEPTQNGTESKAGAAIWMSTGNIQDAAAEHTNSSERTPLLPRVDSDEPPKRSQLPIFQILILLAVRLADNITLTSIGPYINQAWFHTFYVVRF